MTLSPALVSRSAAALALSVAATLFAGAAAAQRITAPPVAEPAPSPHRLQWKNEWPRFRTIEYGVTVNLLVELAFIEFRLAQPKEANFRGGILFDNAVRDGIRLRKRGDREAVGDVSDIFPLAFQAQALLLDGLIVPIFTDRWNFDVSWQMTWMNLMSMGAVGVFNRTGHRVAARERPDAAECRKNPEYSKHCGGGSYASFPGGHASGAFLGAGMSCAHHVNLPLFGGGVPDAIACVVPLMGATATGVMRLMADRHYVSDVIAGSAAGLLGGWLMPTLLHYGSPIRRTAGAHDPPAVAVTLAPSASAEGTGMTLVGVF